MWKGLSGKYKDAGTKRQGEEARVLNGKIKSLQSEGDFHKSQFVEEDLIMNGKDVRVGVSLLVGDMENMVRFYREEIH